MRTLESQLATTILSCYPTAASFRGASVKKLAPIVYDGSHKIGEELAHALIEAAANSVGSHHSEPYRLRIKYLCEDLDVLRRRLKDLARDIECKLDGHEVGKLLTTIDGVGPLTAACLIAEETPRAFTAPVRSRAMLGLRRGCGNQGKSASSQAAPQSLLETLACARRSGWWFSTQCDAIRGCGSTTNGFVLRGSPAKSRSSRPCANCSLQFGVWRPIDDRSFRI